MTATLLRLQNWYASQCDGGREHHSGIKIDTLDNPGWLIKIDLAGTNLEGRDFAPIKEGLAKQADNLAHPSSNDWHSLSIKGSTFEAAGDPSKLEFMLRAFLDWTEAGRG